MGAAVIACFIPIPYQSAIIAGFVIGSSTYCLSTPASPLPCRLDFIFDLKMELVFPLGVKTLAFTGRLRQNEYV